jgi:hypothetical protein
LRKQRSETARASVSFPSLISLQGQSKYNYNNSRSVAMAKCKRETLSVCRIVEQKAW